MKKITFYLTFICMILLISIFYGNAAMIVLKSGIAIKGKLIDRTDEDITIQEFDTRQLKKIKNVFIRELVLDPGEDKTAAKKPAGRDIKLIGGREETNLIGVLQPTIGFMPGIAYPFGSLSKNLALGYGAHLFTDLQVPMTTEIFKVRFGLSFGFMYHQTKSSDFASNLMILPIVAYAKFQFITPVGLRPYIKLGGGITPVISSGGNSFDPTAAAALGLGYINEKIPNLEFYLEAGMMMAFEKVRGDFITASVGVAYRFGAPPAKK